MDETHEYVCDVPEVRRLVDFGLLDQAPRAVLDNVEAQLFPMLADRQRLQHFLDRHYNDVFDGCGHRFDVISPVVLFTTLFYPRMFGYARAEAGILEQDEYYFLIPIRHRHWDRDGEHESFGVVTPYIYVSNAVSTPLGRELFGWQKSVYKISRLAPRGASLTRTQPYLEIQRPVPGRHGEILDYRRVLQIRHRSDTAPRRPGEIASRILETIDQLPAVATIAVRALLSELGADDGQLGVAEQARAIGSLLRDVLYPNDVLGVYSMVQFPHPSIGVTEPDGLPTFAAAFQALMRTELRVRNLRELGLLGSSSLGALDPSRGFSIRVSGYGVDQIVTRLGLQVWACERGADDGHDTHVIHPFFPSAARFDLEVAGLETLARRSAVSDWTDGAGNVLARRRPGMAARYNTFLGPTSADGFRSYGRTSQEQSYRMLGLRAPIEHLRKLCREIAPMPPGISLEPRKVGDDGVVAVIVTRLPPNREPIDGLEWFSGMYVNIAILADVSFAGVSRIVFLETHGFTDNPHAFVVGRELLAANRWLMRADESPQPWLRARDAAEGRHMLSVCTDTLRALNAGDRLQLSPLLDIVDCATLEREGAASDIGAFAPHIEQVFVDQRLHYLRIDTLPTVDRGGITRAALLRCNVERVNFARPGQVAEGPTWLGHHDVYVYPYASVPLVEQLGLYAEPPAPGPFGESGAPPPQRIPCAFAIGGHLPAARRGVFTLFECSGEGWFSNKLDEFFGVDEADSRPFEAAEEP